MATQAPADPSVDQDTEKGEATMEKRYPFALTTSEIDCVLEAIQARISVLQTFPPSAWRYSYLSVLASVVERLNQLPQQVQSEQAIQVGMD